MSELDYVSAILLGAIQGLTEFLPISSSGHLALIQRWLDLDPDSTPMLLFDVLAHLGTLVAVGVVFAEQARRFVHRLVRESSRSWSGKRYAWRIALLAVAATVPTAVIGLAFQETFESAFDRPMWIGVCLITTGALLAVLAKLGRGQRGWKDFRWWQALLVGIAQGFAILPGISRSGATICVASYCGLRRRWAAEFSFLIVVPAIAGGTLLKVKDTLNLPAEQLAAVAWGPLVVGSILSLTVGVFALKLLLGAVRRAKLHYFALYCWVLGAVVLLGTWD
ncbi:MAG: undecaprenyl-diphosphate phosphatase [Phycisphaerae bacterium]